MSFFPYEYRKRLVYFFFRICAPKIGDFIFGLFLFSLVFASLAAFCQIMFDPWWKSLVFYRLERITVLNRFFYGFAFAAFSQQNSLNVSAFYSRKKKPPPYFCAFESNEYESGKECNCHISSGCIHTGNNMINGGFDSTFNRKWNNKTIWITQWDLI